MKAKESGTDAAVAALLRGLAEAHGLDLTPYDTTFLRKALDQRVAATGCANLAAYGGYLAEHRVEAAVLEQSLRIIYSEFFRNPLAFALLEQLILPGVIEAKARTGRGEIRVWSAGCATGQEAWSVAMLLDELTATECAPPIAYRIFATDRSEPDLALARTGSYDAAAVGNVQARRLRAHFSRHGDAFVIAPRLRARVEFSDDDLLDANSASPAASIYGDFDLVLCSNVLLYYRAETRQFILDKLCRALAPGGYLVTGETERDIVAKHPGLRLVAPPTAVFQKKKPF